MPPQSGHDSLGLIRLRREVRPVSKDAAYFTDSFNPRLFVLPIARNGALGSPYELPLGGDYVQIPDAFNLNGIEATPNGRELMAARSTTRPASTTR